MVDIRDWVTDTFQVNGNGYTVYTRPEGVTQDEFADAIISGHQQTYVAAVDATHITTLNPRVDSLEEDSLVDSLERG